MVHKEMVHKEMVHKEMIDEEMIHDEMVDVAHSMTSPPGNVHNCSPLETSHNCLFDFL
jgi:hypothetical protein